MALVSDAIPNLVNGVSQQVYTQRLASQAESQTNMYSTIVDGLTKRPPSRHLAKLSSDDWSQAFLHTINRDASERYAVAVAGGDLKVFTLDGGERVVAFPNGKGYLTASDPSTAFRAVTVADFTFLVNRNTTVAMAADLTPARPKEALVNVRQGNYGRTYNIAIDGVERASFTTPDGGSASHSEQIDTVNIAKELAADLAAAGLTGFTITRYQNAIHISKATGDFSIAVEDGFAGGALKVAKDKLQSFSDLPNFGPDGFMIEIVGDDATSFDNYFVRFEKSDAADSEGVWRETVAPGIPHKLDAATMPHVLVREADGSFTFRQAAWKDRLVGDAESAPEPSFVGRQLNDVFFFRNRLGFLSDENVVLSRAGGFFNFWPKTVTTLVDSDPIDVAGATNQVAILRQAIPFSRSLLVFADQTQFVLEGGEFLTSTNASLSASTEFLADLGAKPALAGRHVYFVVDKGSYAGLREYSVDDLVDTADAVDVTAHVPRYIPKGVFKLASATNEELVALLTRGAPNSIFVYKFLWRDREKLQSSWSEWRFDAGDVILNADFIDTKLVVIVARADGAYLEEIDVDPGATDPGSSLLMRMDRKVYESACSVAYAVENGVGVSTVTLPFPEDAPLWLVTRVGDPVYPEGAALAHTRPDASTLRVVGDLRASLFAVGRKYLSRYVFSPFVIREQASAGGLSAVGEGRLQILYLAINFEGSGAFEVKVTPKARSTYRYVFSGRVLGAEANRLGVTALETGRFKLPVYARNTDVEIALETEGFLPAAFTNAEWEANFTSRSRRV